MSKNNGIIRWSESKKKQRDQERADADALKARQNAAWAVTEAYKVLKRRLLKKKDGRSKAEVDNFLLDLRNKAKSLLKDQPDAQAFAEQLIDEKIKKAQQTGYNERNVITQYLPSTIIGPGVDDISKDNRKTEALGATFATLDELVKIPFVAKVIANEGFVGLMVDGRVLCAWFDDEELVKIGVLANSLGLGDEHGGLPTFQEFRDAWINNVSPENPGKN